MASYHPLAREDRVHLIGSVPLTDAETVMRTASAILGSRLQRLPDGETGVRKDWIAWQWRCFSDNPFLEVVPRESGAYVQRPRVRLRAGVQPDELRFGPLGYADAAMCSYAVFRRLGEEGVLPASYRFLVALPTPLAPVVSNTMPEAQPTAETAYARALLAELAAIVAAIPAEQLAIQWDTPIEFAILEGVMPSFLTGQPDAEAAIVRRLTDLGGQVPPGVELGYHLCYGDAGHRHFIEPADTTRLVRVANGIIAGLSRPLQWVHLPVPRARDDAAYFAPLRDLQLRAETELYLGLVHRTDGLEGTVRRITAARRQVPMAFGIATECGLGRRRPETIPDLLRLHVEASAAVHASGGGELVVGG